MTFPYQYLCSNPVTIYLWALLHPGFAHLANEVPVAALEDGLVPRDLATHGTLELACKDIFHQTHFKGLLIAFWHFFLARGEATGTTPGLIGSVVPARASPLVCEDPSPFLWVCVRISVCSRVCTC